MHSNLLVELPTSLLQLNHLTDFSIDWLIYVDNSCVDTELEEFQTNPDNDKFVEDDAVSNNDVAITAVNDHAMLEEKSTVPRNTR